MNVSQITKLVCRDLSIEKEPKVQPGETETNETCKRGKVFDSSDESLGLSHLPRALESILFTSEFSGHMSVPKHESGAKHNSILHDLHDLLVLGKAG
jgi:hypothetical protein